MSVVRHIHDEIVISGWSCRLPGANSISALWSLLLEGRCAVSRVPEERFLLRKYGHPRRGERGKSYTWSAGIIDDVWGFDPGVFGISPREAEQMDPQQRILLQLTWEALEDAGIPPSSLAGSDTGVFVGASLVEYGNSAYNDPALADSHFGTGNALAVLSNRISYAFDLRGPSLTVDTACSSSLVALHQAVEAIRSGRVDTAIVGGINIIASHTSFVLFSQASMLSPTGLCRAFDAKADGFVRAEGGGVLVLRRAALANANRNPIHGVIVASDVNSDGRTNGISLPSREAQESLLKRVYSRAGIAPSRLAFVEAHGTGTAVGDPIEATAIGHSLGQARSDPLPIGSVKTNLGHLEPASGMAGLLKALLAINHGVLPPSLHFNEPNPHIDLRQLNLTVNNQTHLLPNANQQYAGVNSFGFGGTNAHVILAPGRKSSTEAAPRKSGGARYLMVSAETKQALTELTKKYSGRILNLSDEDTALVASAAAYHRDRLSTRLVVSTTQNGEALDALNAFASGSDHKHLTAGASVGENLPTAFVYSGNGGQWAGMGVAAYRQNAAFRAQFDLVDFHFKQVAGWSLHEAMFSEKLGERLELTSIAQPLIFAIQSASTSALRERGLGPGAVLGHSVGEVAAAEAAGILDLRTAVKLIFHRSKNQETVRGAGRMAVIVASPEIAAGLAAEIGDVEVAALNSPRAVTMAGTAEGILRLKALARSRGIALVDLGLDYPFHTSLMAPIEAALAADLAELAPKDADIPFVSTVSGTCLPGSSLGGEYWWRNVRQPVQFLAGVRQAAQLGARLFVEIGPSSSLLKHISDSLTGEVTGYASLGTLERNDSDGDPFDKLIAKALVCGAQIDNGAVFGNDPGGSVSLPTYPWQQKRFRYSPTTEAVGVIEVERHPLAGARNDAEALEWHSHIDTALIPDLTDHKVGEQIILPGTGFLEIAFSVARQWLKTDHIAIANFEILKPLDLTSGETREVMTRVSPGSSTLEIFSRPRLSRAAWVLNCRGKMLHGSARGFGYERNSPQARHIADRDRLYEIADASGLHYGPAFRQVESVTEDDGAIIRVTLAAGNDSGPYLLDPMRLDCCTQGLITAFPSLRAVERGVAYIPVRLDEATLILPGAVPCHAIIRLLSKNERAIVGNCDILTADGTVMASIRGVRCQAVPVKRINSLDSVAILELLQPVDGGLLGQEGVGADTADLMADVESMGVLAEAAAPDEATGLLEGWATASAYAIASGLARRGRLDPVMLIENGGLPETLRPWLVNLLRNLEAAGLAREEEGRWSLIKDPTLPRSETVLRALTREYPDRAAAILLAGEVTGLAAQIVAAKSFPADLTPVLTPAACEFFDMADTVASNGGTLLSQLLRQNKKILSGDRALRILQLGAGPLANGIAPLTVEGRVHLTIFETDQHRLDREQAALPKNCNIVALNAERASELGIYDVILAADGLHRLPSDFAFGRLRHLLAADGVLLAVEPQPSFFRDLVFGLRAGWFAAGVPDFPVGQLRNAGEWQSALEQAGFRNARTATVRCGSDLLTFLAGKALPLAAEQVVPEASADGAKRRVSLVMNAPEGRENAYATRLGALLGEAGVAVETFSGKPGSGTPGDAPAAGEAVRSVVQFLTEEGDTGSAVDQIAARCLEMKSCAERIDGKATLWLVFAGARSQGSDALRPVASGAWAFSRTLANEFPNLDVRRIDLAPGLNPDAAASRLRDAMLSGTKETELHIGHGPIHAQRADTIRRISDKPAGASAAAARLVRRLAPGQRLQWQPVERNVPGANEVEIEVGATGLNFRDLMWMLGLLPDDILEDGYAGPGLGLECAGRIAGIGSAVKGLRPGDRVMAVAASAFATHVTVPAQQVVKLPDGLSCEAAATIPVAFMTAHYGLVNQAKLKRGEWVLIHGAAGGVGMAAIHIAQARGAKLIVTAGSPAKRNLLKALGVQHVLDSRSNSFVDGVRRITGSGVDVVLNSLAGEAMEQSFACLRGFGRFVELGKRDYVTNTHLGLRPFRKNLSYFGVDIDQLVGRGDAGQRILQEVMRRFAAGTYAPLPYTAFDASDAAEAFHLMQQSAHIGKIVIRPPKPGTVRAERPVFAINPNGTHLITGAFGGFGLETAKYLAERGARHLVLVGRRGPVSDEAISAVKALAARGVQLLCDPCDVTDGEALSRLFEKIKVTMPPLSGVIHSAMVLDDTIIHNLDDSRLRRVLEPKVKGADNLDRLTRALPLDYFVLFSSVTTLIGNPGQGNYVAANAYMEGLARLRRQEGLPALAIGWGPISDVGVVARNRKLQAGLEKLTGARGMTAREALDYMAQALGLNANAAELAVMTVAPNDGSFGGDRLAVLRSPTYASLISNRRGQEEGGVAAIDLRALVKTEDVEVVRRKVSDLIVAQLARVLHSKDEDISRTRPLGEIGLDSLMALELGMSLEGAFSIQVSLAGSAAELTIAGLTDQIIAQAADGHAPADPAIAPMAQRHAENVEPAQIEALKELAAREAQTAKRLIS